LYCKCGQARQVQAHPSICLVPSFAPTICRCRRAKASRCHPLAPSTSSHQLMAARIPGSPPPPPTRRCRRTATSFSPPPAASRSSCRQRVRQRTRPQMSSRAATARCSSRRCGPCCLCILSCENKTVSNSSAAEKVDEKPEAPEA